MEKEIKYYYRILGLSPPENIGLGRWGYSIMLDSGFAVKARENEMNETIFINIQKGARDLSKKFGLEKMGLIENPFIFVENSWLLSSIKVPGDACDLSLDNNGREDFTTFWEEAKENKPPYVLYTPHNVDCKEQAYCLLSLFTQYEFSVNSSLKL